MNSLFTQSPDVLRSTSGLALPSWRLLSARVLSYNPRDAFANYFRYLKAVFTPATSDNTATSSGIKLIAKFRPPAAKYWNTKSVLSGGLLYLLYVLCFLPLHHFVIPWMAWPRTLLYRFVCYRSRYDYTWSLGKAFSDSLVILLSPLSVVLFLLLTALLVLIDITAAIWYFGREVERPDNSTELEGPGKVSTRIRHRITATADAIISRIFRDS